MSTLRASLVLLLVIALAPVSAGTGAHPQHIVEEPGVSGYVLAPDGTPVSAGTVVARAGVSSLATAIDRMGRFRVIPTRSGLHQFSVSVPDLPAYRVAVTVPASRSLRLPVIRLAAGAHFRVRFVSPAGEPIVAPRLRPLMFDASGRPIPDAPGDATSDSVKYGEGVRVMNDGQCVSRHLARTANRIAGRTARAPFTRPAPPGRIRRRAARRRWHPKGTHQDRRPRRLRDVPMRSR